MVLHLLAALAYRHLVPLGQGPDEGSHVLFAQCLAGEAPAGTLWRLGLPVLQTGYEDPNFEVHQPPLYYILAQPFYRVGGAAGIGWLSLLASLATVWLVWRGARELTRPDLALAAAAVVALWPMQTFLAGRVNNDLLANALWAALLWRWARGLRLGPTAREGVCCGLLLGAALLTKQTSLVLVPTALAAATVIGWRSGQWRESGRQVAVTLLVAALVAGWWFARNHVVYGDLFAQAAFDERFLTRRMTPAALEAQFARHPQWRYWPYVLGWTLRSGVIYLDMGAKNILPTGVYPLHAALLLLAGAGAGWSLVCRARHDRRDAGLAYAGLAACGAVVLTLLYVQFNQKYFQAQGRYFFGLMPVWGLLLAGGLSRPFRVDSVLRRYGVLIAPLWLGLLNLALLTRYVPGLYEH
ncbi:MAG: glycosyltransferase family 39 protein [Armatimonadetes bacterium]|nr:glycosyltransferase family 39 protein [Armatimonadota bacterium]